MADDEIQRYVGYGANLAGALTGAAVGAAATGDPTGAVWGAALGASVEAALVETTHRALSDRRKTRVGAVIVLARQALIVNFGRGLMLRSDDFMRDRLDGRASVDEVIEHVLHVAEDAYEERKLPHLAAVLARTATSPTISAGTAHWALDQVRTLSWQKLVALSLVGDRYENPLPSVDFAEEASILSTWSARRVFFELYRLDEMLSDNRPQETGIFAADVPPTDLMKLSAAGEVVHDLAGLADVPAEDRAALTSEFDYSAFDYLRPDADR